MITSVAVEQPPPPTRLRGLCSVVLWNIPPSVPCGAITDYEINLYHPWLVHQSLTRTVLPDGTFYVLSDADNMIITSETRAQVSDFNLIERNL